MTPTPDTIDKTVAELMAWADKYAELMAWADKYAEYDNRYMRGQLESALRTALAAQVQQSEQKAWRCFHCEEVFTDEDAAREHFGNSEYKSPGCQIDIAKYREMEAQYQRSCEEDTDLHRDIYRLKSKHQTALLREEEKGYARGLRDAVKYPIDTGAYSADYIAAMIVALRSGEQCDADGVMVKVSRQAVEEAAALLAAAPQVPQEEPALWQYRTFHNADTVTPGWSVWKEVKPRNAYTDTVENRVNKICELIKRGYKYEIRALYASPQGVPEGMALVRIDLLQKLEPHLDAIICYASTMGEYEPNRLAHDFRAMLSALNQGQPKEPTE